MSVTLLLAIGALGLIECFWTAPNLAGRERTVAVWAGAVLIAGALLGLILR